jgi:DNA (cytosine-5)-methyltransferase 3A
MIKLLIGGSPCTHWSIAQKNDRETQPNSGLGWELFLNYKIALDKYKPDYFLYENNKSASQPIKDEIARCLNVTEPDLLTVDNGIRMTHINSALLSAQQRERFYVTNFGWIDQPQDRGILLKDILEHGVVEKAKAYCLCTDHTGTTRDYFKKHQSQVVFEPVRLGSIGSNSQAHRVYSCYGKSITLSANAGGQGGKTGLYFVPLPDALVGLVCDKGKIYSVVGGKIETKSGTWSVNLPDGLYIIRKLTVNECKRLQTIPEWYSFPVSDQQAYKMIGNGWTIEVIKYLLSKIPNIQNEEIEVLSMYDGMSCGQIALEEMGCNVVRYYATEIDKYAIQTTLHNFPNTIQLGDAFQVREKGWCL